MLLLLLIVSFFIVGIDDLVHLVLEANIANSTVSACYAKMNPRVAASEMKIVAVS